MELPSDGSKIKCDLCQQIFQARKDKYKVHLRLEHDVEEENLDINNNKGKSIDTNQGFAERRSK